MSAPVDEAFDAWWISRHPHPPLPGQADLASRSHEWFRMGARCNMIPPITPELLEAFNAGRAWARSQGRKAAP